MKNLNFLSTIGGTAMGSQSSDTGYRCRVVTDSLPSFCRVKMLRFISVLVLILTIGVGQMWGTEGTEHNCTTGNTREVVLNNKASISPISITDLSYPVKKVAVTCNYNKSTAGVTVSCTINNEAFGTPQTINTSTTTTFNFEGSSTSGDVVISFVNNTNATSKMGTFKVTAVVLTEGAAAGPTLYTVTYDANGGIVTPSSHTQASAGASITLATPTREGYTFNGWYTATSGGTKRGDAGASYTPTSNETVHAQWTIKNYAVHWKVNNNDWEGSTHGSPSLNANHGTKPATIPTAPVSNDCDGTKVFVGWTAAENYSNASTPPTDLFITAAGAPTVTDNVTYHAVFATETSGGSDVTDEINNSVTTSKLGSSNTSSWVSVWETSAMTSGAKYKIYSMGINGASDYALQWNSSGYLYCSSAPSGGRKLKSITIKTKATKNIGIYGSTSVYSAKATATSLNTLSATTDGATYSLTSEQLANNYTCVGINGTASSTQVVSISITYSAGVSYSNYETNCCSPLGSVSGSASRTSATTATLTWSNVTGAEKYQVKVEGSSSHNDWTDATSGVSVIGLSCGTAYTAYFKAIDTNGSHCSEGPESTTSIPTQSWTVTSTGVTNATASPAIPSTTCEGFSTTITAATGYALPENITVTNADKTWNNSTGALTISNVTGDVTLTIAGTCVKPSFTAHPQSKTDYLTTGSATALSYTASAAGASLTQQWQVSSDNSSWDDIDGATSATYTPNIATEGTKYYRVVVTNSECDESKISDVATITSTEPSGYCISLYNSNNNGIQSGFSNGGDGNEYTLAFTVPGKDGSDNWPEYWIGENEAWASFSANATFADMKFTSSNATIGLAEGATGTLHIWDNNKEDGSNLWVKFEPDGYGFRWGDHESDDWTAAECTKAFTVDAGNANTYWTEMVTLDGTNNTAWDYYVGLQTASGYVYSGVDNEASDSRGISRTRSVTAMKVSNGTAGSFKETFLNSEPTGTTGKFRIWNNNIEDYNFVCHFVPFYQLKYNANGGSGTMNPLPATPVSCEESAENRTVTVAANAFTAPTGKQFVKWNTAANGSGADVNAGEYVLTSDVTLYAIWKDIDYTVTVSQSPDVSATTTGQTTTGHCGATINLTTTVPDGYEFVNWTSSDVTITNPTSEDGASFTMPAKNVTVTANFQQIYTITWSANGATTTSTVNAGSKLVLPEDEPASCNAGYSTFIGWYSVAAGTAEDPSDNVSGTKADADHIPEGNETYYAVWGNGELVGGWQKTTSIATGDVVIFVQETASKEMSNIALINTNMCGIATEYTTSPAGTYPLTIETGNGGSGYSFKTSANTYLSWSSNNTLTTSDTKNNASSWTISTSTNGNFKFANVATTERIMQFNNNSGQHRWACYGNDNQTAFQIYKQMAGATEFISNCCEEWTATAKYGESNVINVNDVVDVTVTGTVHGTASYESDDTDVLTVASDGKITGKKAGSATVTISWAGADGYCAYETTVDVTVNGTITVTYNANDGSLTPETTSQNATSNSAFTLDANSFSRTGYTFQGWTTTPSGDKEYNNSQADVVFAEDVTLYAVWSINSHAVTLNQPTGNTIEATGAANLASVAYGTSITLSATENDGYVFTGWSTEDVDLANTNPVVFSMPDNDVTVTATYSTYSWIAADPRYTVTIAPKISYTKVEKFSTAGVVIKENFKRSDDNTITKQETYGGAWTAKLNGVAIANGADLSLDDNGKTLKLYVDEVEIASYTLTVTDIDSDLFIDGLWGETFEAQTGTYDMPTPSSHAAGATDCAKHNTFAGWILEANAENPTVENIITGAAATGVTAANNTYYAVWSKSEDVVKEFTVSKTGFANSETGSSKVTFGTDISYTTRKNDGTTDPTINSNGELRLYQAGSGKTYGGSITIAAAEEMTLKKVDLTTGGDDYKYVEAEYTTSGLSGAQNVDNGHIVLDGLTNRYLTIINTSNSSSERLDISKIEVTYEKEVTEVDYITDCDPRYDVEFLAGTGATGSYDKVTKKAGVEITLPDGSALSKDHYTFDKWYSASYDTYFAGGASYTVPVGGDMLEAQWTEDHHAFVTFKNGENTIGEPLKVYDSGTFDLLGAQSAEGKAFIGWKWNGNRYKAGQTSQHMDDYAVSRTYTAVWMPLIDVATIADADLTDGKWILVENKSQLKAGDFIVIAAAGYDVAMSNYQKNSNRAEAAVTKNNDTLSYTSNVAPLFLQYDPENDYYAFYDRAYDTNNDGTADGSGYLYSDNNLKTQATDINGFQGVWSISIADKKASIVAQGNNNEKIMRYNSGDKLFNCYGSTTQKDIAIYKWAKNISSDMNVSDVTNTDIVIVTDGNTLTINEPATLDNLIVEAGGEVSGSAALTVNNLTLKTSLGTINGDDNTGGKSGEISNSNITANGDVWIEIELTQATQASYGWYAFSVPFPVNTSNGVYYQNTKLQNEVGYAIMAYHEDERAAGKYAWKKYRETNLVPGMLYIITVGNTDYKTLRFKKAQGTNLIAGTSVPVSFTTAIGEGGASGWNGVGNPNLQVSHQNDYTYLQFLDHEENCFRARTAATTDLLVGTAFMVQVAASGNITIATGANEGTGNIALAPARTPKAVENTIFELKLANAETGRTEDNLFFTAREDATNEYEIGRDLTKMTMGGGAKCAQMWVSAYGTQLCAADFPLVNNKATYPLMINTVQAGTYTIEQVRPQENAELYLTKNGHIIWNLTMSPCELELTQGQNNEYGLMLRANAPSVSTDVEGIQPSADSIQKVIIDEKVFILRGGKMYGVDGKEVR